MTWSEYFRIPAINWSLLKVMAESPKHFRHAQDNPTDQTDAQAIGCYVHTATLEPDRVAEEYAIWEGRRAGKSWKAFIAANAGKTILRADDLLEADQMVAALRAHPEAAELLNAQDNVIEQALEWHDPDTGLRCKCRPDIRNKRRKSVIDLKTAKSANVERFVHDVKRYQYHGQLAFYAEGIERAEGWAPEAHTLIVVEKSAPYDVAVFPVGTGALDVGRSDFRAYLDRLKECTEANNWPGRHPKPVELNETNLPPWLFGGGVPEFAFESEM